MARRLPARALGALGLLLLAACGDPDALAPPEIQYGLEECGFCRMILSEEKHASALIDEHGRSVAFDDVGCLLHYLHERPEAVGRVWVHDDPGGGWIEAEGAVFVRGPRSATPMGSGLLAFASREEARAFAREQGTTAMGWGALREETAKAGAAPPPDP